MGGASDTARVAALLTKGRVEGWLMNRYGGVGVRSLDTAAWIHDEMVRSPGRLGDHIGWKVGVDGADSALFPGEENPPGVRYCAPIFSASTVASGSTVTHARGGMRGVEVELGFVLGTRLPSRSLQAEPYTEEEVWGAVSTVELALEVCASRFTCAVPLAVVAADFGNHHALVRGSPVPKSQCPSLRGHSGESEPRTTSWTCQSAGVVVSASPASNADDSTLVQEVSAVPPEVSYAPIESLCWAVNFLTGRGVGLEEGSFILAGGLGLVHVSAHADHWGDVVDIHAQAQEDKPHSEGGGLLSGLHSVSVQISAA